MVALRVLNCPLAYKNGHFAESDTPASDKKLTLGGGVGFALWPIKTQRQGGQNGKYITGARDGSNYSLALDTWGLRPATYGPALFFQSRYTEDTKMNLFNLLLLVLVCLLAHVIIKRALARTKSESDTSDESRGNRKPAEETRAA